MKNASLVRRLQRATRGLVAEARRSLDGDALARRHAQVPDSACFCTACADRRKWNCALGTNPKRWPRHGRDVATWLETCARAPIVDDRGPGLAPRFPRGDPAMARWYYQRLVPSRLKKRLYRLLGWPNPALRLPRR